MALLASITSCLSAYLAPCHMLLYSALLGTELFQTFVNTKVCFNALPRSAFTTLQKRIFPIYFRGQVILLLLTAMTFPPHGLPSLVRRKSDWIPHIVAGATALLNVFVYEPATRAAMVACTHQATRDAKGAPDRVQSRENGVVSPEMERLKRLFSRNHAMTIHLNLITIAGTLYYGWRLGSRLVVEFA